MSYILVIKVEAKNEIVETAHYYSQKVKGLEVRFYRTIRNRSRHYP